MTGRDLGGESGVRSGDGGNVDRVFGVTPHITTSACDIGSEWWRRAAVI